MKKNKFSLHSLISTLLSPLGDKEYSALPGDEITATTVRLEPIVRRYYEDAAKELGVSLQSMIHITLSGLMKVSQTESKTQVNLILDRFFETFEAHSIPTIDIPKFLMPYKISLSQIANHERLLDCLDTEVLNHIANLFSLDLKWLQGLCDRCVSTMHYWYKSPGSLCNYLNKLSHQNIKPEVLFISDSSHEKMLNDRKNENCGEKNSSCVGIILKIPTTAESGMPYIKYEISEYGFWGYEKCRMDLKVIMMFCIQNHFDFRGVRLKAADFTALFHHDILPVSIFRKSDSFWEPADYVIAGYTGDKDTDELLKVADHYCQYRNIRAEYDGKGKPNRYSMWDKFALDLSKYKYGSTLNITDLYNDSTIEYNSRNAVSNLT